MDLVSRAKNICLAPATEWPVIAEEQTSAGSLITGYVAPLAAISAVAGLIGGSVIGRTLPFMGTYRVPIMTGIVGAVFAVAMAIVGIFVLAFVIDGLAPTFGGEKNRAQAFKVAAYSYTPAWIAGVLQILPLLGLLAILGGLYGLYLLYLGLPRLMHCPEDKAFGYTAVVVVCAIVLSIVIAAVGGMVVGAGAFATGAAVGRRGGLPGAFGAPGSSSNDVQFDKDSTLGKLQDLGKRLDESNKKMEAAAKKGDSNAQVAAAVEGLGTLLGGGKRVDPVDVDALKAYIPDTFAGLPKTESRAEKNGIAGLMVSKAEATYGNGADKSVALEIADSGGVSGLVGLAGWAGMQTQREDSSGSERTEKVNGRLTHEQTSKGGSSEFSIVLGDRFVVTAKGRNLELPALKAAVSGLDLGKLEAMKDAGVQK